MKILLVGLIIIQSFQMVGCSINNKIPLNINDHEVQIDTWKGEYHQGNIRNYDWIFQIEKRNGRKFIGQLTVPQWGNTVYKISGEFVESIDINDRENWRYLESFSDLDERQKLKFVLTGIASSSKTAHNLNTWNYGVIQQNGSIEGIRFDKRYKPLGKFILHQ